MIRANRSASSRWLHNVRVDLQREDARVAEPLRDHVHRHPGRQKDRRVRVAQVVQPDGGRRHDAEQCAVRELTQEIRRNPQARP
jgi:hypothetical protein